MEPNTFNGKDILSLYISYFFALCGPNQFLCFRNITLENYEGKRLTPANLFVFIKIDLLFHFILQFNIISLKFSFNSVECSYVTYPLISLKICMLHDSRDRTYWNIPQQILVIMKIRIRGYCYMTLVTLHYKVCDSLNILWHYTNCNQLVHYVM